MQKPVSSDQPPFAADLKPDELAGILQRIDENLELRPLLREAREASARYGAGGSSPSAETEELARGLNAIRELQAPLLSLGAPFLSVVAWFFNLPIRVFGRKQRRFNQELADWNQKLLDAVARQAIEIKGQSEWARLLQAKLENLSLDARERSADSAAPMPEPRIVDAAGYQQKIAAMASEIRVNLGCGEKPLPGCINVDARALPGVDVVADVRRLPFEPGTVAELASAHLVEHFREHQLQTRILPYWRTLLKTGGRVRIVCPNWAVMIERLNEGAMSLAEFKRITFGAQDYEGDDHAAMYTPETLARILQDCQFVRVQVLARDRMNGICPEMELVGHC